jgi:hypothetical protein
MIFTVYRHALEERITARVVCCSNKRRRLANSLALFPLNGFNHRCCDFNYCHRSRTYNEWHTHERNTVLYKHILKIEQKHVATLNCKSLRGLPIRLTACTTVSLTKTRDACSAAAALHYVMPPTTEDGTGCHNDQPVSGNYNICEACSSTSHRGNECSRGWRGRLRRNTCVSEACDWAT